MTNKNKLPVILAIDTSCDETSAAVVHGTTILSNIIASQVELHKEYGGVFPTLAKQAHQENINGVIQLAVKRAKVNWKKINAIAVTVGPGLAPALEIGIEKAKELAQRYRKKLIAINHIEGHILSVLAEKNSRKKTPSPLREIIFPNLSSTVTPTNKFPILSIVISGGHSQFILIKKLGNYQILGSSIDDAAGECLDKVGRMLGLGYPAGAVIEKFAKKGNDNRFKFPLPMTTVKNFDLSFSGLKTFARNLIEKLEKDQQLDKQTIYDCCACLQKGIFRHINYKLAKLLAKQPVKEIWLGGGVAANIKLRQTIRQTIKPLKLKLRTPYNKQLCGDNAAMIALVGSLKFKQQKFITNPSILDRKPRYSI